MMGEKNMGLRELIQEHEFVRCTVRHDSEIDLTEIAVRFYRKCQLCPEPDDEEEEVDYSKCEEDVCDALTITVEMRWIPGKMKREIAVVITSVEAPAGLGVTLRKPKHVRAILQELKELIEEGKIECRDKHGEAVNKDVIRELERALQQLSRRS